MPVVIAYITVVLVWGTTPLAVQWSAQDVDLIFALGLRTLIGLVLTLAWLRWHGGSVSFERRALKLYAVSLLGNVGAMYAIYWASRYIASGLISVLFGLAPIIGGLFASIWLAERFFRLQRFAGVVCALLGLVIIFRQELSLGGEGWKGVLAAFSGMILYSLSSVWIKRLGGQYSSLSVNAGSLLASFAVLLSVWLIDGAELPVQAGTRSFAAIVYLGIFGSFIGFVAYYYVLRNLETSSALMITLLTPVIALYLGTALNGESLHGGAWAGSALVLTGLTVYLWTGVKSALLVGWRQVVNRIQEPEFRS
jgi:drug/metabolite transporter (DMT)-like permease